MEKNLRNAAVEHFQREWDETFDSAVELERCYKRLTDQMNRLAEAGCHMHLQFEGIHQTWWVAYRESQGDLIPRNPVEAPLPPVEVA